MGRRVAGHVPASPELAGRIRALLAVGLSKRAISVRLGVSETTVYRCLRGEGETEGRGDAETRGWEADPGGGLHRKVAGTPRTEQGKEGDDGYPEVLLRRVPRDFLPILPRAHYVALVRAAACSSSAAGAESLRQALLLHAEPMIPPPTSIELVLSEAEEEELRVGTFER